MNAFLRTTRSWLSGMVHILEAETRFRRLPGPSCGAELARLAGLLRMTVADDDRILGALLDGIEDGLWRIARRDLRLGRWYLTERLRHALSLLDEQERLILQGGEAGLFGTAETDDRLSGVRSDRRRLQTQLDNSEP